MKYHKIVKVSIVRVTNICRRREGHAEVLASKQRGWWCEGGPRSSEDETEPGSSSGILQTRQVQQYLDGVLGQKILLRVPDPGAGWEGQQEEQLHRARARVGGEELSDDAQQQGVQTETDRQVHHSSQDADTEVGRTP